MRFYAILWWGFTRHFDEVLHDTLMKFYTIIWWGFTRHFDEVLHDTSRQQVICKFEIILQFFEPQLYSVMLTSNLIVARWCSGYHYCTTLFTKVWTLVQQTSTQHVEDLRWWGSMTMVTAGNTAKSLLSVDHITVTIHHHHHRALRVLPYFMLLVSLMFSGGIDSHQ